MRTEFLWSELNNILEDVWFQQDDSTPHFVCETIQLFKNLGGVISRSVQIN